MSFDSDQSDDLSHSRPQQHSQESDQGISLFPQSLSRAEDSHSVSASFSSVKQEITQNEKQTSSSHGVYGRDGLYVDPNDGLTVPELTAPDDESAVTYDEESGPKDKRRRSDREAASLVEETETTTGQTVDLYSAPITKLPQDGKKGRGGLRKSTETRRNNNRIALRDITSGRRCVSDIVPIDPPLVAHIKVINGVSTEKVLRKNNRTMLLDVGQPFGVLQLFVEGHPKPEEKVWVTTSKGLVPVPSTAIEQTMAQLTISLRHFPVVARGRVRRDPQKQGTRPKAGEPKIDCYGVYVGEEKRPLWIESSLISVEPCQQQTSEDHSELPHTQPLHSTTSSMSSSDPFPESESVPGQDSAPQNVEEPPVS